MNFDAFVRKYNNKAIDYDKLYGPQCVDLVAQYCLENGRPVAYANAKDWWGHPALTAAFTFVRNNPNDKGQLPPRGSIIIWSGALAGSGGYGHIAIFDSVVSPGIFRSFDQNWGGMYCHFVTHNWNNVIGWMVPKAAAPPLTGDKPMTPKEEDRAYRIILERPMEHKGSHRSGYKFILDGEAELNAKRKAQRAELDRIKKTVNEQNVAITKLSSQTKLSKAEQAKLVAQIADANAQLAQARDTIADLEKTQGGFTDSDRQNVNKILSMLSSIYEYFSARWKTFKPFKKD